MLPVERIVTGQTAFAIRQADGASEPGVEHIALAVDL